MSLNEVFYALGRANATELRGKAHEMTGTQIIDREYSVPRFDAGRDYSGWPVGAPVTDDGQVWLLIQPHDAAQYEGRPGTLRALWGLAHTKNPARAKAWVDAYGTSGMYMTDECYRDGEGQVWRAKEDNLIYDAVAYPRGWERV